MDTIRIETTPVKTKAISFLLTSYDKTLSWFGQFGKSFEKNALSFLGNPSNLEMVYSSEPTDDESILKARETIKFWREQPEEDEFFYMDLFGETQLIHDFLNDVSYHFPKPILRKYFNIYKPLIRRLMDYMNDVGEVLSEDLRTESQMFIYICKRVDTLRKEGKMYLQDYADLKEVNKARWMTPNDEMNPNCETWRVEVFHNKIRYGGVMVYHNDQYLLHKEKYIFFQYIGNYPIPYLAKIIFQNIAFPKLNSLLNDPVNQLAIKTDSKRIAVHPLDRQAHILEEYYGYKVEHEFIMLPGTQIEETNFNRPAFSKNVEN